MICACFLGRFPELNVLIRLVNLGPVFIALMHRLKSLVDLPDSRTSLPTSCTSFPFLPFVPSLASGSTCKGRQRRRWSPWLWSVEISRLGCWKISSPGKCHRSSYGSCTQCWKSTLCHRSDCRSLCLCWLSTNYWSVGCSFGRSKSVCVWLSFGGV